MQTGQITVWTMKASTKGFDINRGLDSVFQCHQLHCESQNLLLDYRTQTHS